MFPQVRAGLISTAGGSLIEQNEAFAAGPRSQGPVKTLPRSELANRSAPKTRSSRPRCVREGRFMAKRPRRYTPSVAHQREQSGGHKPCQFSTPVNGRSPSPPVSVSARNTLCRNTARRSNPVGRFANSPSDTTFDQRFAVALANRVGTRQATIIRQFGRFLSLRAIPL